MAGKRANRQIVVGLVLVGLLLAVVAALVPFKKVNEWTCAYTGSRKGNTVWLGFMPTSDWYRHSPLEKWQIEHGMPVDHRWVRTVGTSYTALYKLREHEPAPPVYTLGEELQDEFLSTASEDEVKDFLAVLKSADEQKAHQTVEDISKKVTEH